MISIVKNNDSFSFCIGKDKYPMTNNEVEKISNLKEIHKWHVENWMLKRCNCIWCTEYLRDHVYLLTFKNKKWHVSENEILKIIKDCAEITS